MSAIQRLKKSLLQVSFFFWKTSKDVCKSVTTVAIKAIEEAEQFNQRTLTFITLPISDLQYFKSGKECIRKVSNIMIPVDLLISLLLCV